MIADKWEEILTKSANIANLSLCFGYDIFYAITHLDF